MGWSGQMELTLGLPGAASFQYEYEFMCLRTPFDFTNILAPVIAQNWFCIQNLHMDLSFQEEKKRL